MVLQCLVSAILVLLGGTLAVGAEPSAAEEPAFTDAERELLEITTAYRRAETTFFESIEDLPEEDLYAYAEQYPRHDPSVPFLEPLRDFERAHRGTPVGLLAGTEVLGVAARCGDPRIEAVRHRRELLTILPAYRDSDLLPRVLQSLAGGSNTWEALPLLDRLARDVDAPPTTRAMAKFVHAEIAIQARDARPIFERRLARSGTSDTPRARAEKTLDRLALDALPSPERAEADATRGITYLEELARSDDGLRIPAYRAADEARPETWPIVRFDPEGTKTQPLIRDRAAGELFRERHLKVGRPAPDLAVDLLDGTKWSLADQKGRTVVIQFSFTGCGGCEQMYPTLAAIAKDYGDRVSVLTVMSDRDRADTVAAVESGKITWHVTWEAGRGPVTLGWGVSGFPSVYVIDRDGRIANAVDLALDEIRPRIEELVGPSGPTPPAASTAGPHQNE